VQGSGNREQKEKEQGHTLTIEKLASYKAHKIANQNVLLNEFP